MLQVGFLRLRHWVTGKTETRGRCPHELGSPTHVGEEDPSIPEPKPTMINFIRHTAATDMYRKQDRQNKHIQLENIKKKTRSKNISYGTVYM